MRIGMMMAGLLMPVLMLLSGCVPPDGSGGNGNDGGPPQIGKINGDGVVEVKVTGLVAKLTAVPDDGWRFVRWNGPNDVSRFNPHNVGAAMVEQYEVTFLPDGVPDGNGNDNGNDNGNGNGNGNSNNNGNDNGNDNGNENGNDNGNENQNGNDNGNENMNDNSDDDPVVEVFFRSLNAGDTVGRFGQASSRLEDGITVVTGGVTTTNGVPPTLKSVSAFSFFRPISRSFADFYRPTVNNADTLMFDLNTARSYHVQATMSDGRVLFAGGDVGASGQSTGAPTASAELFDPALGTVEATAAMSQPRSRHTATVLSDGRILVAGGTAWQVFNADTELWSTEVAMEFQRVSHAAALLTDFGGTAGQDRVLIVGGNGAAGDKIELLDPQANTSTTLASTLPEALTRLTATTLPDGRVLVVGGVDVGAGDTTNSAFLIDASADTVTPAPSAPNRDDGLADHRAILEQNRFVIVLGGEQNVGGVREVLTYYAVFDTQVDDWVDDGVTQSPHDDFIFQVQEIDEILISGSGQPEDGDMAPTGATETLELTIIGGG